MDINKLKTALPNLSKQSNIVDTNIVNRIVYDKLVTKINFVKEPSTSGLVIKTQYDSDKHGFEKKIADLPKKVPNTSGLVKESDYNSKIEKKILSITG